MTNSVKRFFTRRNIIIIIVLFVLIIGGFLVFGAHKNSGDTLTIQLSDFVQKISVSGQVVAAQSVNLTFPESGRVSSVPVQVGDHVTVGQRLVMLEANTQVAQLRAAQADLAKVRASSQSTETSLDKVTNEQNTLVENAREKMLSDGLVAVPTSDNFADVTPPVLSGLYRGQAGMYRIIINRKLSGALNTFGMRLFGLEKTDPTTILHNEPTPLGTKGLFISFPEDLSSYDGSIWTVTIPNTNADGYLANAQAFNEAERTHDRAIAAAQADLANQSGGLTANQANILSAEAEVMRLQAVVDNLTLRAPFAGIVTHVDAKIGGIVSAGTNAVSIISADTLQIESYVPELNIPFVRVGQTAAITLDAYGDSLPLTAHIIAVDPAETIRDGISMYRIKLVFDKNDERIKSGMTANVEITAEEKTGVISVPQRIVTEVNGKKFVPVRDAATGKTVQRQVTVGQISSSGEIEILSGLNTGDTVVLPTTP